jgi:hypothetical protein
MTVTTLDPTAAQFLAALGRAEHRTLPYHHWLLERVLPEEVATSIAALPFPAPGEMVFNGRRETNNSQRVYFTRDNQARHTVCRAVVDAFQSAAVRGAIADTTGADLAGSLLRIEYCQDTDGFWLEPHTDIAVKKFTLLVYLSDDPALADAGTDIYEGPPGHRRVGSAPYGMNKGLIFIPAENTWHGVEKRKIRGLRKSIIVNYVTPEWRDKWELA